LKRWAVGGIRYGILGRFVIFQKAMWVCNVCPHGTTLFSHWTDFHEVRCLGIF